MRKLSYNIFRFVPNWFALILSLIVIIRWWYFINQYSVNILFYDQWDLYNLYSKPYTLWTLFRIQLGPHRQGVGAILTVIVGHLSGWNTRTEAFVIGGIMCLAMICALILKRRLSNNIISWQDVAIPLMFLTPLQYELFVSTPNPTHGSLPLLLLMLYCLAWTVSSDVFRYVGVLLLNFFLIFTGFGLFMGIITPVILTLKFISINRKRLTKKSILLLVSVCISLLSMALFFIKYRFTSASPDFEFPVPQYWKVYPSFIIIALANFFGIKYIPSASLWSNLAFFVGSIIFVLLVGIGLFHLKCLFEFLAHSPPDVKGANLSRTIIVLITFSLIFCVGIAIGRVAFGLEGAQSSRYIPYLTPGFFAIYLHLTNLTPNKTKSFLLIVTLVVLIGATFPLRASDRNAMIYFSNGKSRWKSCYFQTNDIEEANQCSNFVIYPTPDKTARIEKILNHFREQKLNLYLDYHAPTVAVEEFIYLYIKAVEEENYEWLIAVGEEETLETLILLRPKMTPNYTVEITNDVTGLYEGDVHFDNGIVISFNLKSTWPEDPDYTITEQAVLENIHLVSIAEATKY